MRSPINKAINYNTLKMPASVIRWQFTFLLLFLCHHSYSQQLAFPGAEGFGKYSTGGRGGKVVAVENLNDDGPGSFRQALVAYPEEPTTVIFRVSGIIELKTPLQIRRSNLTVAGQTAPGNGICLKGHSLIINGARAKGNHGNIIIRYIRSRPGGTIKSGMYGIDIENCHDVIIDHCSFSWANEEVVATYDTKNITIQWCIISEGLYDAGHQKGYRSYGGVWGGQNASYHHNLLAHLNNRVVRFGGSRAHDTVAQVDYQNNVIYNWGNENAAYGGDIKIPGGVSRINMQNNYYISGPATAPVLKFVHALYQENDKAVTQWYLSGNIMEESSPLTKDNWKGLDLSAIPESFKDQAKATSPFPFEIRLPVETAKEAYRSVLSGAGAVLPKRDEVDLRIINETKTKTATGMGKFGKPGIIDNPLSVGGWGKYNSIPPPVDTDADGMPDRWEEERKLNPKNAEDRNVVGKDGYTMLEEYLNYLINRPLQ
jgi:hypothetical protein